LFFFSFSQTRLYNDNKTVVRVNSKTYSWNVIVRYMLINVKNHGFFT